jgi:hypothetical protein
VRRETGEQNAARAEKVMRTLYVDGNSLACEIQLLAKYLHVDEVPFTYANLFHNLGAERVYFYDA